jgi:hypothetical protein
LVFASQAVGTTSSPQTVTVENYGNATRTISSVATTGPFLVSANTCGTSLAAGLSCTISVELKPTQTGAASGDLILTENAGDSPQMIALSGTGAEAQSSSHPNTGKAASNPAGAVVRAGTRTGLYQASARAAKSLKRIGGDDGTRTRGLCRDRVAGRRNLLELNGTDSPFLIL